MHFLRKLGSLVTGGLEKEVPLVLLAFSSLFTLMSSYYLVRPLRKGFFTRDFSADVQPYFNLGVILLLLLVTAILSYLYQKVGKDRVVVYWYRFVSLVLGAFGFLLVLPAKWIVASFCLWASIYFPITLAFLWGTLNKSFNRDQSRRSYGFILLGATFGALTGLQVVPLFIGFKNWQLSLFLSAALTYVSLKLLLFVRQSGKMESSVSKKETTDEKQESVIERMLELVRNPYLLSLAIITLSLTFSRQVFELQSQQVLEREITMKIYLKEYSDLNRSLNLKAGKEATELNQDGFEFMLNLKNLGQDERKKALDQFFQTFPKKFQIKQTMKKFENFREGLMNASRKYIHKVWTVQNILCVVLLLIFKAGLIRIIGIRTILLLLPITYLLVFSAMMGPTHLELLMILQILILTFDYSLNNLGKELLYVPLDSESNLRFKPVIEGPVFKLGAAGAAGSKLALDGLAGAFASSSFGFISLLLLACMACLKWIQSAFYVAKKCEELQNDGPENLAEAKTA